MTKAEHLRSQIKSWEGKIRHYQTMIDDAQVKLRIETVTPETLQGSYCGKILYSTEKEASKAKASINESINDKKAKLERSYFCNKCNAWHLTSKKNYTTEVRNQKPSYLRR